MRSKRSAMELGVPVSIAPLIAAWPHWLEPGGYAIASRLPRTIPSPLLHNHTLHLHKNAMHAEGESMLSPVLRSGEVGVHGQGKSPWGVCGGGGVGARLL